MATLYLYGVTRPRELPARLADNGIFLVESDGRAAVVSELGDAPVEASRRNLLAHADAVEELHEQAIVLPTRFGTVLDDRDAVVELLGSPEIEQLLERHRDHSELTVKGTYEETVLQEVSRPLAPLQEAYRREPSMERGIALGEAVTEALEDRRARDLEIVLAGIQPHVEDVVASKPVGEWGALDVAVLVRRDAVERFETALEAATAELCPPLHLRVVGPLPPYSFVSLELPVAA